jgi:formate dehydrogenase major subunit
VHREPIYTSRTDLLPPRGLMAANGGVANPPPGTYPALTDRRILRMPTEYQTRQLRSFDAVRDFPLVLTSGRLVEYEGGGEETRSNRWLAELQQEMFIEIHPADAEARGVRNNAWVWVSGPEMPQGTACRMKALVTERVGRGVTFCPFHFGGWFLGEDRRRFYPPGTDPIVLGESVNAITTYGYDPVTGMQETKVTLCQVRAA